MNRNAESHFSMAPNVNIPRSVFKREFSHLSSANVGQLIPHYWHEVLPGESLKLESHKVIRLQPLVSSPMSDLFADEYFFFVPNRLLWSHWKEFMGENTSSPWVSNVEYSVPQLKLYKTAQSSQSYRFLPGGLLDYFGMPINLLGDGSSEIDISALYCRAYALIVREFFQDQNIETPVNVPLDEYTRNAAYVSSLGVPGSDYNDPVNSLHIGGYPYIVNRYHDYFSSCTPGPTKSLNDILAFPNMPVITGDFDNTSLISRDVEGTGLDYPLRGSFNSYNVQTEVTSVYDDEIADIRSLNNIDGATGLFVPSNLMAISGVTINDLRSAFMVQRLLERDLYGTRYRELLKAHFSVTPDDKSMQVPQYLGGKRIPVKISQILQTSETNITPQGNVAGYSLTSDSDYCFDASFTEHGIIIGLLALRYKNIYQNGIPKQWSRKTRYDYYWPELAGLGNLPVYKRELFADGSDADAEIFGYQEAWAEYRYPNADKVTGEMRSGLSNSLDSWHFADYYTEHPTLSRDWMKVDKANVDRTLAVTSNVSNQYWFDCLFVERDTLPMPLYSIPGLGQNW